MRNAKKILLFPLVCLSLFLIHSCSKERLPQEIGFIEDSGSFATGGCEFIFVTGLKKYKPQNLPLFYQKDGMPVVITYSILNTTVPCPNAQNFSGAIHIHHIREIK